MNEKKKVVSNLFLENAVPAMMHIRCQNLVCLFSHHYKVPPIYFVVGKRINYVHADIIQVGEKNFADVKVPSVLGGNGNDDDGYLK